jgi:hypothetical protein
LCEFSKPNQNQAEMQRIHEMPSHDQQSHFSLEIGAFFSILDPLITIVDSSEGVHHVNDAKNANLAYCFGHTSCGNCCRNHRPEVAFHKRKIEVDGHP